MRVAIVDDHELVREGIVSLFASQAATTVNVVYSGALVSEALQATPDVLLLDVDLGPGTPHISVRTQQAVDAGVGVLLISAFDEAPAIRAGLEAGALGFVPKRASYDELMEGLSTVDRDELYLSVELASILASSRDVPDLSPRELDALRLYAAGLKLTAVAHRMGVSPHTAKEYLDRVRKKYEVVGRRARTRTELYAAAQEDGLLATDH